MRPIVNRFGLLGIVAVKVGAIGILWKRTEHLDEVEKEQERFWFFLLGMLAAVNNIAEVGYHGNPSILVPTRGHLPGLILG